MKIDSWVVFWCISNKAILVRPFNLRTSLYASHFMHPALRISTLSDSKKKQIWKVLFISVGALSFCFLHENSICANTDAKEGDTNLGRCKRGSQVINESKEGEPIFRSRPYNKRSTNPCLQPSLMPASFCNNPNKNFSTLNVSLYTWLNVHWNSNDACGDEIKGINKN